LVVVGIEDRFRGWNSKQVLGATQINILYFAITFKMNFWGTWIEYFYCLVFPSRKQHSSL